MSSTGKAWEHPGLMNRWPDAAAAVVGADAAGQAGAAEQAGAEALPWCDAEAAAAAEQEAAAVEGDAASAWLAALSAAAAAAPAAYRGAPAARPARLEHVSG